MAASSKPPSLPRPEALPAFQGPILSTRPPSLSALTPSSQPTRAASACTVAQRCPGQTPLPTQAGAQYQRVGNPSVRSSPVAVCVLWRQDRRLRTGQCGPRPELICTHQEHNVTHKMPLSPCACPHSRATRPDTPYEGRLGTGLVTGPTELSNKGREAGARPQRGCRAREWSVALRHLPAARQDNSTLLSWSPGSSGRERLPDSVSELAQPRTPSAQAHHGCVLSGTRPQGRHTSKEGRRGLGNPSPSHGCTCWVLQLGGR